MATLRGAGTIYYGKHEKFDDGSYVTTQWITFFYLPLVPLGSYKVKPTGEYRWDWPARFRDVERLDKVAMTGGHVWHGYRKIVIVIGAVALFALWAIHGVPKQ